MSIDDQKYGAKDKDENQTADEKHISKLAGDVKHDEKKEGVSRRSSSPLNAESFKIHLQKTSG